MNSNSHSHSASAPGLDLSRWRNLPVILMVVGAIGAGAGLALGGGSWQQCWQQFGFSWLLAFMFSLSLCLGGWFLVIVHHLFDASWSVPTRRFCEHLACLLGPTMLILFIPIALTAWHIYPWMQTEYPSHPPAAIHAGSGLGQPEARSEPRPAAAEAVPGSIRSGEHSELSEAIKAKYPLFTMGGYYVSALILFAIWWLYSNRLRYWSLRQDETGSADCTHRMRFYAASGVVLFAFTLTLAAIVWIKGLMVEWASTMFGVWYFAESVWVTLPTVYVITLILQRAGPLRNLVKENTYYMIGSLFLAFTVFWAYISFAQYFIIWNANMPDETFWYVLREKGTWGYVGKFVIIFGHFFLPFLMLLRIDWKLKLATMLPLVAWAWLMHFVDLEFQIMPALHPASILSWGLLVDIGCVLIFAGALMKVFVISLNRHPVYPLKDPRMAEALGVYTPPAADHSITPEGAK